MLRKREYPENYLLQEYQERTYPTRYTNIKNPKEDHGRMLLCTSMMSVTNSIPIIFQTLSPLLVKSTNLNFRITHSSKTKSRQAKIATIKELIFCIFDKKMQAKIK
jgi:hypothetical protein